MKVLLVNAPWAELERPSLALGILRKCVEKAASGAVVDVQNLNLDYVDWITQRVAFELRDYNFISIDGYFQGYGDWIFSSALYDDPLWRVEEFRDLHSESFSESKLAMIIKMHALSAEFADEVARKIVDRRPDVVGFTSTFQQNTAALSIAKRIKSLSPNSRIVFGGANCDGVQGAALHRNFPFVDFVVRGEGERVFPELIGRLADHKSDFADVDGLCWKDDNGVHQVNQMAARPLAADAIEEPEFGDFYERLQASVAARWVDPKLVVEGARGCWWGEKHHCTFCGLNGTFMEFRSKSPDRLLHWMVALAERYRILDFIAVDNILDSGYFRTLLPDLAEAGYDIRMHCEVKSNLTIQQLRILRDAGIMSVQPGIESLSTHVLRLMDKGVSGCQNVRVLRDAASVGLTVNWNYLYGFPGETSSDYIDVIRQFPALHHLPPVASPFIRISLERFSPYFDQPNLGFKERSPDQQYGLIYDLPPDQLSDLAYLFRSEEQGIGGEVEQLLGRSLAKWQAAHPTSRLDFWDAGQEIILESKREQFDWSVLRLEDPVEIAAFRLLDQPRTASSLATKLQTLVPGQEEVNVSQLLDGWIKLGLVYTDSGRYVHVATERDHQAGALEGVRAPRTANWKTDAALTLWRTRPQAYAGWLRDSEVPRRSVQSAEDWYRDGVHLVRFSHPVDLVGGDTAQNVASLCLIRELTGQGIAIEWTLNANEQFQWRDLDHLHPPTHIDGIADAQAVRQQWTDDFHLCRLFYRRGPGFVQIRDHRFDGLRRLTLPGQEAMDLVARLEDGAQIDSLPDRLVASLAEARLIGTVGDLVWWLPYRVQRWPTPAMSV
ncbi:RiPP maturation radical SAM C-methyltransferase [Streptomyces sp. NPDC058664]|uniref:RiPP maturation radical SAM C-methyltransferase n=1 Tax=unclassified Streptomyces TaxID=2593676 RepID=UPI003653795D